MSAYYNENDPFAATWLRKLIEAGKIAPGHVDERSVEDVRPSDLAGFTQCHFFAGIGVWSYALRCAGWPDDRPVWTGSCPCQPFSAAGRRKGTADERHLWPAFYYLLGQCRPDTIFGEQVASKDGLAWLDLVSSDLEAAGYAFGAVDTCAAGFGAPHIRQRLYWVAHAQGRRSGAGFCNPPEVEKWRIFLADSGANVRLDNPLCAGLEGYAGHGDSKAGWPEQNGSTSEASGPGGLENPGSNGRQARGSITSAMTGGSLSQQAKFAGPCRLTVSGELLTGSSAAMESGGQLSPEHPRWLMGLPPEWDACAVTATPLSRRKPKRS